MPGTGNHSRSKKSSPKRVRQTLFSPPTTAQSPSTRATAAITEREFAAEVARVLATLTPGMARERRAIIAEVLVHVVYSMLNFSVQDGQSHEDAVAELKRIMMAYLLVAEKESRRSGGSPTPDPDDA